MAGSRLTDLTPAVVGDLDNDTLLYIVSDPSGSPTDKSLALSVLRARLADDFATAAQGALAETAVQPADLASGLAGTIRHVRWTGSAWPARPPDAEFVVFVSTHDPAAVAPTDINLAQGDYWLRAPGV